MYKISALGLAILATACTPEIAQWTPAESPKENKVERAVFKHHVGYAAHAAELGKTEKQKLMQFLKEKATNPYSVTVTIEEHGGHSEARVKAIEKIILLHGVPYDLIQHEVYAEDHHHKKHHKHHKHHKGHGESGVTVVIERYVVIPPSCANFSEQIGNANQTHAGSNFGCSVIANNGMMIANPRDLIRGRTTDNYDGTVMAAGVNRYHNDKVKPLLDTSTTVPPGSQAATTQTPGTGGSSTGVAGATGAAY